MRSPSQQLGEGQPGATELVVEPDAEVVQSHPRRQTSSHATNVVGPLPVKAEGVEEFVVNALDYLADASNPPPH